MKKKIGIGAIVLLAIATTCFMGYSKAENALEKWRKEKEEQFEIELTDPANEDADSSYLSRFKKQVSFEDSNVISYDYNFDGLPDFLIRLNEPSVCKNNLCPIFLILQKSDRKFDAYIGPYIRGKIIAVSDQSPHKNLNDLLFLSDTRGYCTWNWESGADQDYSCAMGTWLRERGQKHE